MASWYKPHCMTMDGYRIYNCPGGQHLGVVGRRYVLRYRWRAWHMLIDQLICWWKHTGSLGGVVICPRFHYRSSFMTWCRPLMQRGGCADVRRWFASFSVDISVWCWRWYFLMWLLRCEIMSSFFDFAHTRSPSFSDCSKTRLQTWRIGYTESETNVAFIKFQDYFC